jgi:hypothetical protein
MNSKDGDVRKNGMVGAGRLFGLTPAEWSLLFVNATLYGCLTLFGV